MRFILLLKSTLTTESGNPPTTAQIQAMMSFYSAMNDAGVVLAAEGLHASSAGVRVTFHSTGQASAGSNKLEPRVVPGPFTPAESLVAGYWIIRAKDLAEAMEWAKKCPLEEEGATIEVRRIVEMDDEKFDAGVTEEIREQAGRMRRETEERVGGK